MTDNNKVTLKRKPEQYADAAIADMISSPVFSGTNTHNMLNKAVVLGEKSPYLISLLAQLRQTTESGDTGESALLI